MSFDSQYCLTCRIHTKGLIACRISCAVWPVVTNSLTGKNVSRISSGLPDFAVPDAAESSTFGFGDDCGFGFGFSLLRTLVDI